MPKETTPQNELMKRIKAQRAARQKLVDWLIAHLDDLVPLYSTQVFCVNYTIYDIRLSIWVGNGINSARFYQLDNTDIDNALYYTPETNAILYAKAIADAEKHGQVLELEEE